MDERSEAVEVGGKGIEPRGTAGAGGPADRTGKPTGPGDAAGGASRTPRSVVPGSQYAEVVCGVCGNRDEIPLSHTEALEKGVECSGEATSGSGRGCPGRMFTAERLADKRAMDVARQQPVIACPDCGRNAFRRDRCEGCRADRLAAEAGELRGALEACAAALQAKRPVEPGDLIARMEAAQAAVTLAAAALGKANGLLGLDIVRRAIAYRRAERDFREAGGGATKTCRSDLDRRAAALDGALALWLGTGRF